MSLSLLCGIPVHAEEPEDTAKNDNLLRLWYDEAATNWETQALAIGNGYMGAMVFGGVQNDKIHLNEKTIWGGNAKGNFGNTNPTDTEEDLTQIKDDLEAIREKLDDKSEFVFGFDEDTYQDAGTNTMGEAMNWLNKLMGNLSGYDAPEDYADIRLDFSRSNMEDFGIVNYVRDLDLRTALATVNYDYVDTHYTREYFNSYPDNVLVIRLEASQKGKLTFDAKLANAGYISQQSLEAEGDTITQRRKSWSNSLQVEGQLKVLNEGGDIQANGDGSISVTSADAVTLIFACGTDYAMEYPDFRTGKDPHEEVTARIEAAAEKGYEELKKDHLEDYTELFSRVELGFNEEIPQIPTDELIVKYRNMVDQTGDPSDYPTESEQRALEILCYQFGRYLTIAGSREGALPTNLQGVWGEGSFDWGGDYHFNINIQMNYWPTMASNLAECHIPYNDYLEALRFAGRQAAASAFGIKSEAGEENGWLVGCFSTPYMFASMGQDNNAAGWNPAGSAWALINLYEYYLYTGNVEYLRDNIYPSMKEVSNFWKEALWWSDAQQRWVSAPSYSPEHGPIVNGASYDQQLVWQHLHNTVEATNILIEAGYLDGEDATVQEDLKAWTEKMDGMDPVLVGEDGQVKEWFEETTIGKAQAGDLEEIKIPRWQASLGARDVAHRHISHLMALYPGNLINKDNDEFMDAAMITLNQRGLNGSGWSKGHKLNLWARTGHAEETFEMIQSTVGGGNAGFLTNLFSSHGSGYNYKQRPIFQIDGNFGYTAGVNEMLLQSQLGYTQFLPTIPDEWNTGFVNGIVARGNFEIDMKWTDGAADFFKVHSNNGGEFIGEYAGLSNFIVTDSQGKLVTFNALSGDKIFFETEADETYTIQPADGKHVVTFESNGGSAVEAVLVEDGQTVAKPAAPTKDGFTFDGWYTDEDLTDAYEFTEPVKANLTLYAKWTEDSGGSSGTVTTPSYTITVTQSTGGKITPSTSNVKKGADKTFTIAAGEGYKISDVLVDGKSVGTVGTYTFKNVAAKHTITAKFEKVEETTNVGGFIDVKSTDWFAEAVQYAVDNGLMNGTSSNKFSPNGDTTRGMIVTILYRQAGSPEVESDKATWWSDARVWAMANGISDGTNMDKEITREQLATMLFRYAELMGEDVSKRASLDSFQDGGKVSGYAVEALKWATAEGIVTGKTGGVIDPQAGATRAETATMFMRFCETNK